jgi:hypothetical protein
MGPDPDREGAGGCSLMGLQTEFTGHLCAFDGMTTAG